MEVERSPGGANLAVKTIEIDDDPLVDILQYLEEACDWIEAGLGRESDCGGYVAGNQPQPGVLVHCRQGISRSGAFVVAFLMRKFKVSYSAALTLARESRTEICPNSGFEKQLRVWEFCQYNVFRDDDKQEDKHKVRSKKQSYKTWLAERDNLLQRGEEDVNRARFSSLASMAARFGRRRQEEAPGEQAKGTNEDEGRKNVEQKQRKESWERVQKMEQDWNERLIRGQVHAEGDDIKGPKE
ncbi:hypothetical protein, variant [Cladophialophora immunda]|nr:hypothetical protein, variant [Cladophialophora immunda]KIW24051.1 hypothetical protein, variant [Cladophialophora immunda]